MFYAPEILSRKSRTELSLVYYLSTTGSLKRITRREILELDFGTVLEQIRDPRPPFALRLYSHLLQGLTRVWAFKMDFYMGKAKSLLASPRPRASRTATERTTSHATNANLQICEDWISDVEDSRVSSNVPFERLLTDDFTQDFTSRTPCMEKKMKIDHRTVVDRGHQTVTKGMRVRKVSIPGLIECHAVEQFIASLNDTPMLDFKRAQNSEAQNAFWDDVSVEDPRVSSSLSQEKDGIGPYGRVEMQEKDGISPYGRAEVQSRALWFYSILVSASKGELTVFQERPFGKLIIRHN